MVGLALGREPGAGHLVEVGRGLQARDLRPFEPLSRTPVVVDADLAATMRARFAPREVVVLAAAIAQATNIPCWRANPSLGTNAASNRSATPVPSGSESAEPLAYGSPPEGGIVPA